MKLFLDATKPLYTCKEKSCEKCDVGSLLNCHFHLKQLLRFLSFGLLIFILGGIGVTRFSGWALLIWLLFIFSYFGLVEIRVMCSHCPHYAEPELKSLKCWANYGSPKLWKYRPGPMSLTEKIIFFAGLFIIFLFPVPLMMLSKDFILLVIYVFLLVLGTYLLKIFYCAKCMNFACPLNKVDTEIQEKFYHHNDTIYNAQKKDSML
jgi:MFS family permease